MMDRDLRDRAEQGLAWMAGRRPLSHGVRGTIARHMYLSAPCEVCDPVRRLNRGSTGEHHDALVAYRESESASRGRPEHRLRRRTLDQENGKPAATPDRCHLTPESAALQRQEEIDHRFALDQRVSSDVVVAHCERLNYDLGTKALERPRYAASTLVYIHDNLDRTHRSAHSIARAPTRPKVASLAFSRREKA